MAFQGVQRAIEEARSREPTIAPPPGSVRVKREGYVSGVPIGGTTQDNPGQSTTSGAIDRHEWMDQLFRAYLACNWASVCVDVVARTCTAGGIQVVPKQQSLENPYGAEAPEPPPQVKVVQQLLEYVNPEHDIRQLMRQVITDLQVYGDSFTEVVWWKGHPIALYPLDPRTIDILADEHGTINGYYQKMETGREVTFATNEVIHVALDPPGGGLYGISPTQKQILPIQIFLFTDAIIEETMRAGDPIRIHIDWPIALPESELQRYSEQYLIRNKGAKNIGNPIQTKGGAIVNELGINKLDFWQNVKQQARDEVVAGYGCPPSKVGIIESANIGGGQGSPLALDTPIPTPDGWTTMGALVPGDMVYDEKGRICKVLDTFEAPDSKSWRVHFSDGTHIDCSDDHLWTVWTQDDRKRWEFQSKFCGAYPEDWPTWSPPRTAKTPWVYGDRTLMRAMRAQGMSAAEIAEVFGTTASAITCQWNKPEKADHSIKTLPFGEMVDSIHTHNGHNFSIPATQPLEGDDIELPIEPYCLGYMLGDGSRHGPNGIYCHPDDREWLIEEFRRHGYDANPRENPIVFGVRGGLYTTWHSLGLSDKHIPAIYFRASLRQRLALLQGLIDSDGHVRPAKGSYMFSNTNKKLVDGFMELARSVGAVPGVSETKSRPIEQTGFKKPTLPGWEVHVSCELPLARLPRKAAVAKSTWKMAQKSRFIVDAAPLPNQDMRCISVDSENSLFLAGEGMIPTHNTQDRSFRLNTCGPLQEVVLEKFSFALLFQAYGITDWRLKFGEVDWRDDETIENIRDMRIRNGLWTRNRGARDIGEPPVEGGDDAIIVDRQNMVLWSDLNAMSKANVKAVEAKAETGGQNPIGSPATPGSPGAPTQEADDYPTEAHARMARRRAERQEAIHRIVYSERLQQLLARNEEIEEQLND